VAYKGADRAGEDITRSKEEAQKRAEELLEKVKTEEDFEKLAKRKF
jgi:PPIC-type PPIASE domain.